jgi:transcriptional regulator with XRE-family HTH domain
MGSAPRPRPARLAVKLQQLRMRLGVTQAEMFERLGDTGTRLRVGHVGEFETGERVPTLQVALAYARAAGIPMELIVNDDLDLPERLPPSLDYEWVMSNGEWVMRRKQRKRRSTRVSR